jgi:AraC-like DNA-binding protein
MLPDSAVLTVTDPYEHQRLLRNADVRLFVTAPGDYQAELTRIDLHRLWMMRNRDPLPRLFHTAVGTDRIVSFFLNDGQQAPILHSGSETLTDQLMVYAPGTEHYQRSGAPCRWGTMSLRPDDLAAAGLAIAGRELLAPRVTQRLRPPPSLLSRLRELHTAAGNLAVTVPDILAHPQVARAIEHELICTMVRCLTEGEETEDRAPSHRRLPVMRRFEETLNEKPMEPIYLTEMCAALGVSLRTLHQHCLEHLGMSPHRYLLLRRMNLARHALARANPESQTVTEIAMNHGFGELGRFSVAYRNLFGERPSVTLQRVP